nr:transposase [Haloechinothrix aidingensis]
MVSKSRTEGVELTGPNGLLSGLTKQAPGTALEAEPVEYIGYDKHDQAGRNWALSRNGARTKTVTTDIGSVEIESPRRVWRHRSLGRMGSCRGTRCGGTRLSCVRARFACSVRCAAGMSRCVSC